MLTSVLEHSRAVGHAKLHSFKTADSLAEFQAKAALPARCGHIDLGAAAFFKNTTNELSPGL